ncbi:MAG: alkylhydroperoxidase family enzyme, partial [Gammaproteobacteria bacterium]
SMCEQDIVELRAEGVSDTEILEAVQSTACFAYWVRFINALGIQLGNETIGKYGQNSDPD